MSDDELKVVMTFDSRIAAETAASRLQAAGMDAGVWADDAGGAFPQLAASRGVRLMVPAADAARAKRLLSHAEGGGQEDSQAGGRENGDGP